MPPFLYKTSLSLVVANIETPFRNDSITRHLYTGAHHSQTQRHTRHSVTPALDYLLLHLVTPALRNSTPSVTPLPPNSASPLTTTPILTPCLAAGSVLGVLSLGLGFRHPWCPLRISCS